MKERKYILIIVLIVAIVAVIVAAIYFNNRDNKVNETNNATNDVTNNTTNNPVQTTNKDPYSNYKDFTWKREISAGYTTDKIEIIDSKLYKVSNNVKTAITTVTGVPKYVNGIIRGGALENIIVITEDGTVWKNSNIDDGIDITMEDKFTKVAINAVVIDMTEGNEGVVPYSGPYYLTKEGKLLREDGKTYEQINGQHISSMGSMEAFVYINKDKTASYQRIEGVEEFVLDQTGKKVTLKQAFSESSERFSGTTEDHFYVVTEDNKLYDFSATSFMVASGYYDARDKTVESLKMVSSSKIRVNFFDGTNIDIQGVYSYFDMSTNKTISF